MGSPAAKFVDEKEGTVDDESGFVDELPLLGKTQEADDSEEITEHGQSQLSHLYFSILPHGSAIFPLWDEGCPGKGFPLAPFFFCEQDHI
jgi:hypothetical protein